MTAQAVIEHALAVAGGPHLRDHLHSLDELDALPPVQPLVDGLLYSNSLAQLAGEPGSFKSFIGVGMACAVASGRPWCGHQVSEAGNVVYVAAEGAAGLAARVKAWCEVNRVPFAEVRQRLRVLNRAVQLGEVMDVSQACDIARETQATLLVLDTRAKCTIRLVENDATDQSQAIHELERIQQAAGGTVLGLHHTPRAGDHGRGSSVWDAAVWSDLRLKRTKERCTILCHKHKDAEDGCSHAFRTVPHIVSEHLMPRYDGESDQAWSTRRSTLVVVQSASSADPALQRPSVRSVLDIVQTSAGQVGLTADEICGLVGGAIKRASVNAALKMLREAGHIRVADGPGPMRYLPPSRP